MRSISIVLMTTAATIAPFGAMAAGQPVSDAEAPNDTADSGLGDIVVTAQRRSERLQDVPLAVNALNAEALARNDIQTLEDLTGSTPGFVATKNVGYGAAPLSIRGVGGLNGGANFFNDEPVAVYLDGVYVGRLSFSTADLLDIESIQVLRGPQATLYGRNSIGGALLVSTQRPTRTLFAQVKGGYNSFGDWRAEGVLSGPLGETLSARVALAYSDRDGFGKNTVNGRSVGGSKDFSGRASLRFQPSSDLTADLIVTRLEQDAVPASLQLAQVTGGTADSPFIPRADLKQVIKHNRYTYDDPNFFESDSIDVTFLLNWNAGFATLDYIAGFRQVDSNGAQDVDGTALANNGEDYVRQNNGAVLGNKQYTQDLRLTSPSGHPFRWLLGASYIHEKNDVSVTIRNFRGFAGLGTAANFTGRQTVDAYAAFADLAYDLTDALTLTVGGRYSYEKKDFSITQRVVTINGGFAPPVGMDVVPGFVVSAPPTFAASDSFRDFSMRIVGDYKVTEDVLAYASYTEGFKSGGFNAFGLVPAFKPESIKSYELGLKSELLDRRVRVNAAAFRYDYKNIQIRRAVPTGGVDIQNAASARIRGVEVETSALVTEAFRLGGNVAFLDAKFLDGILRAVPSSARYRYGTSIPLVDEVVDGNRLSRAPRWQLSASAEYTLPVDGLGQLRFAANYKYQSNVYYLETNQTEPTFQSGAWTEVGARVTLASDDKGWEVTAFVENIFDERYVTQVSALASFPVGSVNEPRKFGIQAKYAFR